MKTAEDCQIEQRNKVIQIIIKDELELIKRYHQEIKDLQDTIAAKELAIAKVNEMIKTLQSEIE